MSAALTPDQVRARFDAALDGELEGDERADFERALANDDALRGEYERYRALLQQTEALGRVSTVDLLAGVQHKLRARSGGRFYRDRFAERAGRSNGLSLWLSMSALLVMVVLVWFAYDAGLFAR